MQYVKGYVDHRVKQRRKNLFCLNAKGWGPSRISKATGIDKGLIAMDLKRVRDNPERYGFSEVAK